MLAVVFAVEKFHTFIYGHTNVIIQSDHKPLETIVKKDLHKVTKRLQSMCIRLLKYPKLVINVFQVKNYTDAELEFSIHSVIINLPISNIRKKK